ncbi:hypothetical protein CR513_57024, partial [Mucuna pruriens]
MDITLFKKESNQDFIMVQIYVDDIVFGATDETLCKKFFELMQSNKKRMIATFISKSILNNSLKSLIWKNPSI